MSTELWIVVGVVVVLAVAFILTRNSLIEYRNRVDEAWSGIDVQLKRRHDLVPNLVETVKGYATHERGVLEDTARARSDAMAALGSGPQAEAEAEAQLSRALTGLRAVAEDYPDLRASENFQNLQRELSQIEDEIQASRRIYNSNVQVYNTRVQVFPSSIVAALGGLTSREFFEIANAREREPVEVTFG